MDIKQVLQARTNRNSRLSRPFRIFFDTFEQCTSAANSILEGECDPRFSPILERSAVISAVTSIEVFYRDMLDFLFWYCSPLFFEPHLKAIHPEKYDIVQVLEIIQHEIHPLEIVSSSQSFQNVGQIDKVFSLFIGKSIWSSILELQVRVNKTPEKTDETWEEVRWSQDDLAGLKSTFDLRHELVHNPARRNFITSEVIDNLWKSAHMLFGSEVILNKVIEGNKDPKLDLANLDNQNSAITETKKSSDGEKFFRDIFDYFRIPGFALTSLRALEGILGEKIWFDFLGATSDFSVTNQTPSGLNANSLICHTARKGIIIENEKRPDFVKVLKNLEREFSIFSNLSKIQQTTILEKFVINKDAFIIRKRPHRNEVRQSK